MERDDDLYEQPFDVKLEIDEDMDDEKTVDHDELETSLTCYMCPLCGKGCSSERHLSTHIAAEHGEGDDESDDHLPLPIQVKKEGTENNYSCKLCPRTFDSSSALNVHYTHTHKDKPQYDCVICGKCFLVKRDLSTHRRTHVGQTAQQCAQCGKEFGTKQLLRKHELWHTGQRAHVCLQCGKAFFQKGHLTQHMQIHSGGRPHACQLCPKTFIFKFDLNRHMKIHAERELNGSGCSDTIGTGFVESNANDEENQRKEFNISLNEGSKTTSYFRRRSLNDCAIFRNSDIRKTLDPIFSSATDINGSETLQDESSPASNGGDSSCSSLLSNGNCCEKCAVYRGQLEDSRRCVEQLESLLVQRHREIERLNGKVQTVNDVAARLLESCSDFDKVWIEHSKTLYSQMQDVLNALQ